MVIDKTYFTRQPLYIPAGKSLNVSAPGAPVEQGNIDRLVEVYEAELLINAIGITYYTQLVAALGLLPFAVDTDPPSLATADQKWQDLILGHTYTIDGREYRWEGLRGRNQVSLIAFYCYAMYLRDNGEQLTSVGVVKPDAKNSSSYTPTKKFINAWQTFLTMYQVIDTEQPAVRVNAFGTIGLDYYGTKNRTRSLLQYFYDLNNHVDATRFPDLEFGVIPLEESYNSFGI